MKKIVIASCIFVVLIFARYFYMNLPVQALNIEKIPSEIDLSIKDDFKTINTYNINDYPSCKAFIAHYSSLELVEERNKEIIQELDKNRRIAYCEEYTLTYRWTEEVSKFATLHHQDHVSLRYLPLGDHGYIYVSDASEKPSHRWFKINNDLSMNELRALFAHPKN